jgi:hypothetical protein
MKFIVALATDLREKHGIFRDFEVFHTDLLPGLVRGQVAFQKVLHAYKLLNPAIHRNLYSPNIDVDAWFYALRRLPVNITSVFAIVLGKRLLDVLQDGESTNGARQTCSRFAPGHAVTTPDRRRTSWEVAPGKLFVLMRGDVDQLDFISCLCLHTVELLKMRALLKPVSRVVPIVRRAVDAKKEGTPAGEVDARMLAEIEAATGHSISDVQRLWPGRVAETLTDILVHHGDYSIFVATNLGSSFLPSFFSSRSCGMFLMCNIADDRGVTERERWMARVRANAVSMVGSLDDPALPPLTVDIISSNTHSVISLLSPYIHRHRADILSWGATHSPDTVAAPFRFDMDRLYALCGGFFAAHPAQAAEKTEEERVHGIVTLEEQEFTGITVQLIDIGLLRRSGGAHLVDDRLSMQPDPGDGHRHLLVNMLACNGTLHCSFACHSISL